MFTEVEGGYQVTGISLWNRLYKNFTVDIPSQYNGKPVVAISDGAFMGYTSLISVKIPDTVKKIGAQAFFGCVLLANVDIPDSVTHIGAYAFSGCAMLTSVTIPDRVTTIGNGAFNLCTNLSNVTIGNGVTAIGVYAFYDCKSLTHISIPDSVTAIGTMAFYGCDSLYYNLYNNDSYLGNSANPYVVFMRAASKDITSCNIYPDTKAIYDDAFSECTHLTDITIPDRITSIGSRAFYNCNNLTAVAIPDSVTTIGASAFSYCNSLAKFEIRAENANYSVDSNGILYNKDQTILIQAPGTIQGNITIPNGVTTVSDLAFAACYSLTGVTIPDSVTSIGESAFSYCIFLNKVTIGTNIATIGDFAFSFCTDLHSVCYSGSQADWEKIKIGFDNDFLTQANIAFNSK